MLTGLYSHNNGVEGFQRMHPGTETLPAYLNEAGYLCGIVGKPLRQQFHGDPEVDQRALPRIFLLVAPILLLILVSVTWQISKWLSGRRRR